MNACRQTTGIFWGSGCANQFGSMPKLSTWVMQMPLNLVTPRHVAYDFGDAGF
jgi:hypothetical protein